MLAQPVPGAGCDTPEPPEALLQLHRGVRARADARLVQRARSHPGSTHGRRARARSYAVMAPPVGFEPGASAFPIAGGAWPGPPGPKARELGRIAAPAGAQAPMGLL